MSDQLQQQDDAAMQRKCHLFSLLVASTVMLMSTTVFSAAWVLPKGDWFTKTEFQTYRNCRYWDHSSELQNSPCYHQDQLNPYIEYGATKKLTVGLKPFFRSIEYEATEQDFNLDNAEVYGRYLLWSKDYQVLSGQLTVNIPFRDDKIASEPDTVSVANVSPFNIAQRQVYTDIRLLYATGGLFHHINKSHWYTDFQIAYREYYEGAADEIHVDFTQAWKSPKNRVEIMLKEYYTISMGNPNGPNRSEQPNYDLLSLEPSILVWLKPRVYGVQAGVIQDLYGRDVGKATTPFIALWALFD